MLSFDRLETRDLPAVTIVKSPLGDLAVLQGTQGADVIVARERADGTVLVTGAGPRVLLPASIRYLYFTGGGGDDYLLNDTGRESLMHGGAGNDRLVGGRGFDVLKGDWGTDQIQGDPWTDGIEEEPEPGTVTQVDILGGVAIVLGTPGPDAVTVRDDGPGTVEVIPDPATSVLIEDHYRIVLDLLGGGDRVTDQSGAVDPVVLMWG